MEQSDHRVGVVSRWRTMSVLGRARLQALPYLIAGELAYLFAVFGSHRHSSLSRWIMGFYLQVFLFLVVSAIAWWEHTKNKRIALSPTRPDEPAATGPRLDELEAWVRQSHDERARRNRE